MSETLLRREDNGAIANLTLNNPAKLNVLSDAMLVELLNAFNGLENSPQIRVVTLRGAGKAFCAGHDLREMTEKRQSPDGGAAAFKTLFDTCSKMMSKIRALPQPVIAQTHGIATAAGCQLVASCDLAIAADDTRFGVNGVNIGLFCSTPMVALSRNIPQKQAFEMLTTGDFIDASQAQALGLINRAVPEKDLDQSTQALAQKIASKLGSAVKIGKEAFYKQSELPLKDAYEYVSDVMVENMLYAQTEKGIQAFLNKEKPEWDQ